MGRRRGSPALGNWRILLVASRARSRRARRRCVRQLLLTGMGLVVAIGLVGVLIVRQQRIAAALAERLRTAETLRSLERQLIRAEKLATTASWPPASPTRSGRPSASSAARAELLMDELAAADAKRALDAIVQQIDRISSTIRQVLDFSRASRSRCARSRSARRCSRRWISSSIAFGSSGSVAAWTSPRRLPPLAADRESAPAGPDQPDAERVRRAVRKGGTICDLARPTRRGDRRARSEIRDNGEGIPPSRSARRVRPVLHHQEAGQGTGLGLPVAASIVRNHGGEISLASVRGEGTTVTILLAERTRASHVEA